MFFLSYYENIVRRPNYALKGYMVPLHHISNIRQLLITIFLSKIVCNVFLYALADVLGVGFYKRLANDVLVKLDVTL